MNIDKPLVSVLMTAYNREKYIAEAIESVLASTYENFELIIVDDCSVDNTVAIAREFELKDKRIKLFVNEKNLGQFANRNKAASLAEGSFLKYFDSDDIMFPHCLSEMVSAMQKFPEAAAGSISIYKSPDDKMLPIRYSSAECYINHYFRGNPLLNIGPSGSIIKRAAFFEFKGFNEDIGILADTLLMLQMAAKHPIVGFKNNLFHWRMHDEQVTIGQEEWFEMLAQRTWINSLVLDDEKSPLSVYEIEIIKRNMKNILVRNILKRYALRLSFFKLYKASVYFKIKLIDFILAIKSNKRIYV